MSVPLLSRSISAPLLVREHGIVPCLLLSEDRWGVQGLYCMLAREGVEATLAYLAAHYPDGLARLLPLGDLLVLGPTPESSESLNSEGDYLPAQQADYPPAGQPSLSAACAAWQAVKPQLDYACCFHPGVGWRGYNAWGAPLPD